MLSRPAAVELDDRAATVGRVGTARDESGGLELLDRLRHRLRPHPVRGGKLAHARRALALQAAEDGELRDRRAGLGAQSPH